MGDPTPDPPPGTPRCLSLWQPFATLVVLGPAVKPHETRRWAPPFRGPVLIHAALRNDGEIRGRCDRASAALAGVGIHPPRFFPFGALVGVALLADCAPTDGLYPGTPDHDLDREFGDWSPGRFAWRLTHAVAFPEPIPYRGTQGLFTPEPWAVTAARNQAAVSLQARGRAQYPGDPARALQEMALIDLLFPALESGVGKSNG